MKKTIKLTIIMAVVLACFSFGNITINAIKANDFVNYSLLGGKLINGPRIILYTVSSDARAYFGNINQGVHDWMYTGYDNPIYMYPVTSNNGSTIDIYTYNNTTVSTIARTSYYDKNNKQQSSKQNYLWCKIELNNKYKYNESVNHNTVLSHELGHVLGLDHNNNTYSIMYGYNKGHKVNKP